MDFYWYKNNSKFPAIPISKFKIVSAAYDFSTGAFTFLH